MTLRETIDSAWKTAMKERDPKKDTLSLIRTEIQNRVIAEKKNLPTPEVPDELVMASLMKMAKQRTESIEEYGKGGRDDLVAKEKFELSVIETFLPKALSQDEVNVAVKAAIAETGATSSKDLGKVMKAVMTKCAGRASGKEIQAAVKALLP